MHLASAQQFPYDFYKYGLMGPEPSGKGNPPSCRHPPITYPPTSLSASLPPPAPPARPILRVLYAQFVVVLAIWAATHACTAPIAVAGGLYLYVLPKLCNIVFRSCQLRQLPGHSADCTMFAPTLHVVIVT